MTVDDYRTRRDREFLGRRQGTYHAGSRPAGGMRSMGGDHLPLERLADGHVRFARADYVDLSGEDDDDGGYLRVLANGQGACRPTYRAGAWSDPTAEVAVDRASRMTWDEYFGDEAVERRARERAHKEEATRARREQAQEAKRAANRAALAAMREAEASSHGALLEAFIDRQETPREEWHGTINGYSNHHCRCGPCTGAWRDYYRGLRERRREETRTPVERAAEVFERFAEGHPECSVTLIGGRVRVMWAQPGIPDADAGDS